MFTFIPEALKLSPLLCKRKKKRELNGCSVTEWCQKAGTLLTEQGMLQKPFSEPESFKPNPPSVNFLILKYWTSGKCSVGAYSPFSRKPLSHDADCSWHLKLPTNRCILHLPCNHMQRSYTMHTQYCLAIVWNGTQAVAGAVSSSPSHCLPTSGTFCWMLPLAIVITIWKVVVVQRLKQTPLNGRPHGTRTKT